MKKFFEEPSVEVIAFAVEDVITVSGGEGGTVNPTPIVNGTPIG